jgi:hypothetical protein
MHYRTRTNCTGFVTLFLQFRSLHLRYMTKNLLAFTLLLGALNSSGQQNAAHTIQEIRLRNPFDEATQVKVASFWIKSLPKSVSESHAIPMQGGTIAIEKLDELVVLSKLEVDTLIGILYNTCYLTHDDRFPAGRCFLPRNGIIFYNGKNEIFGWIEVCFECSRIKTSDDKIFTEPFCEETFMALHAFFRKHQLLTNEYELADN